MRVQYWTTDKTVGALISDRETRIVATTDGAKWSALRTYNPKLYIPAGARLEHPGSFARAWTELQALVAWARRAALRAAPDVAVTTKATPLPGTTRLGDVTYVGFDKIRRRSAHDLKAIHKVVTAMIARAAKTWKWRPRNLEISFHKSQRAFGYAYNPGGLKGREPHRVSFEHKLLEHYDLPSFGRTFIHELCHHYREERYPRPNPSKDWHDTIFCRELARVDPKAKDKKACTFFVEARDRSLVDARAKRDVQERAAAHKKAEWKPTAGQLRISVRNRYSASMAWTSRRRGGWTPYVEPITDESVVAMLKRFKPNQWRQVEIVYATKRKTDAKTLYEFVDMLPRSWSLSRAYFDKRTARN